MHIILPSILRHRAPEPRLREMADAFERSLRRHRLSPQRLKHYRKTLTEFAAWAGASRRMPSVRPDEAEAYAARIPADLASATYNDRISTLRTAWRTLVPAASNPWMGLLRRPSDSRPREPLSKDELSGVLAEAGRVKRYNGELPILLLVGAYTGLRLGDAIRLKWPNVGEDSIHLRTRKTGSEVSIPLFPELREALASWRDRSGSPDFVFPVLGQRVARYKGQVSNLSQIVESVFRQAGLETSYVHENSSRRRPLRGFHSLRHTFVTRLMEAGIPAGIVASLVGHASVKMTEHYVHVREDFVRDALTRAGLLGG